MSMGFSFEVDFFRLRDSSKFSSSLNEIPHVCGSNQKSRHAQRRVHIRFEKEQPLLLLNARCLDASQLTTYRNVPPMNNL